MKIMAKPRTIRCKNLLHSNNKDKPNVDERGGKMGSVVGMGWLGWPQTFCGFYKEIVGQVWFKKFVISIIM